MTFPHHAAMLTLIAIAFDDKITVDDGQIVLEINGSGLLPDHGTAKVVLNDAELEALESRGWIEHRDNGETVATEQGRYAVKRWYDLDQQTKRKAMKTLYPH